MLSLPKLLQPSQALKLLIVLFILAIAVVPTLPNYVTQNWSWKNSPGVPTISQLKELQETGLTVAGWQTAEHQVIEIGGKDWSTQTLTATPGAAQADIQSPAILMLRPQTWNRDQPQVEWMDIKEWLDANGTQQWTIDSRQSLSFTVDAQPAASQPAATVKAQFLRSWSRQQTYAMLQWYAWTNGGSPSPNHWFWADQLSQWRNHQRMPWVAVSLLIPIQPLDEIEPLRPLAESLGQAVQSALMVSALAPPP